MRNVWEKIVAGLLTCSGFVTSLTIVLIVLFLFSEALGLFGSKVIEEGYVLALNKENVVDELSPKEIKDIFDEEITNWKEVGGADMPIKLFRLEDVTSHFTEEQLGGAYENAGTCITSLVEATPGIIAFVPEQFIVQPDSVHLVKDNTISVKDVFAGAEWFPTATPAPQFGFLPLITGTLWVSFFAILIALPFGLAVAIYMSEVANHKVRNMLKPVIELLSGIPSVVYGFFGLIVIVPFLQEFFNLPVGESGLAGALVLAIMALPTIITVTEDAMRNCPRAMREASLALGATHWLHLRHHLRRGAGHRPCRGRDDGRADGDGQCRGHSPQHPGAPAHHPCHHCRRTGRGSRRRGALWCLVHAGRGALLHQFVNQLHGRGRVQ